MGWTAISPLREHEIGVALATAVDVAVHSWRWTPCRLWLSNIGCINNSGVQTYASKCCFAWPCDCHESPRRDKQNDLPAPEQLQYQTTGHQTSPTQAQIVRLGSVLNDPSGWLKIIIAYVRSETQKNNMGVTDCVEFVLDLHQLLYCNRSSRILQSYVLLYCRRCNRHIAIQFKRFISEI